MAISTIPTTAMNTREYVRVFGSAPIEILPEEVIVDIGSGRSDLSTLVSSGTVVQVDPTYVGNSARNNIVKVEGEVGNNTNLTAQLTDLRPDRVTVANTLRYLDNDSKITAIGQMLRIAQFGIFQTYPFDGQQSEATVTGLEKMGFTAMVQPVRAIGARQTPYRLLGINNTLTILNQPYKCGPGDRLRAARFLTSRI